MTGRCYLDTSAYLATLLDEPGGAQLRDELREQVLVSSSLLVLEAQRNLVRLARQSILSPSELQDALERLAHDMETFELRDLTLDLCRSDLMPVVSTPRSLDLVHLRTARWFHDRDPLKRFVSRDLAQIQAARELGLPI